MIARLAGTLAETSADTAVVDVNGVGYLVLASAKTLDALGPAGGSVTLLTELQVREDSMTLFAFGSAAEREAFRQLTNVPGGGGRRGAGARPLRVPPRARQRGARPVGSSPTSRAPAAGGRWPSSPSSRPKSSPA